MYFNFRRILSQFLGTSVVRKPKGPRRRHQPARVATETLEVRMLLSGMLVSEALSGTASTTIIGTVYEDANSNGVRDQGEDGIPNWQVYLDLDNSGTRNTDAVGTLEPLATTNVDGDFTINQLKPGTYRLAEVVQDGWVATNPISQDVVVKKDKDNKSGDFFNFSGGDIVGTVWNDLNADAERAVDPVTGEFTEPGLAGWTMFIDRDNSRSITPGDPVTLTDANGHYRFSDLPPGDYKVWELLPANWDVSPDPFDNKQTVTVVARAETTQDYANFSLVNGSIQGTFWNDLNADGDRATDPTTGEFTEPGLENWTVFLDYNSNGTPDAGELTTLTDANGAYSFISVAEGTYEVTEVLPDGWYTAPFFDTRQSVDVHPGEAAIAEDFANFTVLNGSIRGTVWNDLNRDGVRNVDLTGAYRDPGLANWTVFLDLNHNKLADAGEPTLLTDAAGGYSFPDLQVGDYEVQEILPSGWETTIGYGDSLTVTVYSGAESVAGDFANFNVTTATLGSVGGAMWSDLNGNGVRDLNAATGLFTDHGLAGQTVYIDVNSNNVFDATEPHATTGVDGSYLISGVTPGSVRVLELVPSGWRATNPLSGSHTLALKNGENASGFDFGNYAPHDASLSGTVYADANKDGIRNAGERGLAGITVYLDTNGNGSLDAGEPQTTTAEDQFFTPAVNEAGIYSFTHLAMGGYTVRVVVPTVLNATPPAQLTHDITLAAAEARTGLDTAAVFRPNEIHGVKFDDVNGNHQRDAGESGKGGTTVYIDLNRNDVRDADEPTTVTAGDGAYSFGGLTPGAYVVRAVTDSDETSSYPQTSGGTVWPAGTSNPAVGDVSPTSITTTLAAGATHRETVSITLPNSGALTNMVDVFLLFDDTGSFVNNSPIVRAAFPSIITQLQASLPGIDLGFGVGRFEEYANFAWEYSTGRPFILNQPIVAASTPEYMTAIQAALNRTTPGYGGDGPETDIEALYQLVTGVGFDGNNNGSVLDSGNAGLASTQLTPGASGDVPSFASFQADTANSVLPAAGNVGGGGFRAGALPIILTATDIGFAYQPHGESTITGVGGTSVPVSSLTQTSRPSTPFNSGAGLQQTITALNALGAMVIGLGTNPQANFDPRQGLEALSLLTGAVNHSATTIDNGTADPIAPGDPLYFQIASGFSTSVSNGVVNAIQNAVTNVAVDLTVQASDPRVKIINHTGTKSAIGAGQTAIFDIEFVGDGVPHRFDLQFVRAGTNVVLGSIPVLIGTPVPGTGYEFEDLPEGEIHHNVDFGTHVATTGGNLNPTDLALSPAVIAENQPVSTVVGSLTTSDPDAGDTFTYQIVGGDVSAFSIDGNALKATAAFDFEGKSSYSVTIRTTDAGGLSLDKAFTISIGDVNEAPTDIALSATTVAENLPAGTLVGTLTTADPDAGDSPVYSIVAGDAGAFAIDGDTLRTAVALDYETKASYSMTVRVTDAGGLSFDKVFAVTVLDRGGLPPVITLPAVAAKYTENGAAVVVNATATVIDPDTANYDNGILTISFQSGSQADDRLAIRHQGVAAGQIGLAGANVTYGGVVFATISGGFVDNSALVLALNANAKPPVIAALSKNVTFRNVGENPTAATRTLRVELADGTGELNSATLRDIAVTPVNDIPILTASSGSVAYTENQTPVIIDGAIMISDVDSVDFSHGSLKVSFASGAVKTDRLVIVNQGSAPGQIGLSTNQVQFGGVTIGTYVGGFTTSAALTMTLNDLATPAVVQALARQIAYFNSGDNPTTATRVVQFVALDGDGGTSKPATRQIVVTPVNDAPVLGAIGAAVSYTEGKAAVLVSSTATVVDPDSTDFAGGSLTVSLPVGSTPADVLEIRNVGILAGQIGVVGGVVTYGGIEIGAVSGGVGGANLVVSFNSKATPAAVQALVRNVTFRVNGAISANSTRTIRFSLTDGDSDISLDVEKQITVINLP